MAAEKDFMAFPLFIRTGAITDPNADHCQEMRRTPNAHMVFQIGAANGTRTRDPKIHNLVL